MSQNVMKKEQPDFGCGEPVEQVRFGLDREPQDRLANYTSDDSLGRDFNLLLTVKSAKQRALNRILSYRLRNYASSGVLGGRNTRRYRDGLLVYMGSGGATRWQTSMKEPFGLDLRESMLAMCSANEVHLYDLDAEVVTIFRHDWFAQLHSVHFSPDGRRLLVASSGFDTIIEFDVGSCEMTWSWCAWGHGYNRSPTGARFVCKSDGVTRYGRTERIEAIANPKKWGGFGIPGGLTATYLNNAQYLGERSILVTLFHQGEALVFDRGADRVSVVVEGLLNPHGFEPAWNGEKVITDTRRGCVWFLDENFEITRSLKIDAAPPVSDREQLTEWLQNALPLRDGLYGAIDTHRSSLWIIDITHERYRRLALRPEWAVQSVEAVGPDVEGKLDKRLAAFARVHKEVAGTVDHLSGGGGEQTSMDSETP